jgi:hypothetical protein
MRVTPAALQAACAGDIENFIAASTPGGIEAQEKRGQQQFTEKMNDLLPIEGTQEPNYRAAWVAMGFTFAEKPKDDLFISANFPAGWTKQATDHSMWSKLLDDKGRERANIFYKAAFYDRKAHVHLIPRYGINTDYDAKPKRVVYVVDCGKRIHKLGEYASDDYKEGRKLNAAGETWLTANFPEWKDATKYWD